MSVTPASEAGTWPPGDGSAHPATGDSMSAVGIPEQPAQPEGAVPAAGGRIRALVARLSGLSRRLSIRTVPVVVGLACAAVVSFPLWRSERAAVGRDREDIIEEYEHFLESRAADYTALLGAGKTPPEDGQSWVVDRTKRTVQALGPTDLEPPLFNLATAAKDNPVFSDYAQAGRSLITYARSLDDDRSLITVTDAYERDSQLAGLPGRPLRRTAPWAVLSGLLGAALAWVGLRPAARALAQRQDFLSDAAHEMRTPLAVIQASASHALGRPRSSEEYVRSLSEIRAASERAATGVTELLDLARFDAGQAVPRIAPLRLDLLAEEVASSNRFDDCDVITGVGPSVLVQADMALLRQAVDNVVRNAASRASKVTLTCYTDGRDGVIEVADNGPGFATEHLPYVFERFRRADRAGSSGLGLAIVAAVLAAHGGKAEALNAADGGGAVIRLRVPRAR